MENYVGKICPFCKTEIKEGDAVKVCPACNIPHHEGCWEENKGCTTFGCSEQHYEEQHTNPTDVCKQCGTPLGDGQAFCPKCGTPKVEEKKNICGKCGAELQEGQEFCPKCGQKVGLVVEEHVSSAIDQFNAGVGEKKKKKSKKIIFAIAIPVVLIAVGLLVFSLLSGSFKGKYVYVSGDFGSYYNFEDDYYIYKIYKTSEDTERGKYAVEKDQVTLTNNDGDNTVLYRDGKYIFKSEFHYDEKIQDGSTVTQKLTKTASTKYEGYTLTVNHELSLKSDGTYTYTFEMTYIGVTLGDKFNESGTYERSGNRLILSPKGENYTKTFIIRDGIVYDAVFMKDK